LKFFDILCNKPSRGRQKFAVGVTKLMPPDEIRRFDGTDNEHIIHVLYSFMKDILYIHSGRQFCLQACRLENTIHIFLNK
jgi:hypothetical protein